MQGIFDAHSKGVQGVADLAQLAVEGLCVDLCSNGNGGVPHRLLDVLQIRPPSRCDRQTAVDAELIDGAADFLEGVLRSG
jgi:hypothetical protein